MKQLYFFITLLSVCCAVSASDDLVELYEYDGVLEVEVPYETILSSERMHAKLKIENRGDDPITVVRNGRNDFVQLAWIPWENGEAIERPGRVPGAGSYQKLPTEIFSENNLVIYDTEELPSGSSYEIGHVGIGSITSSIPFGTTEIQIKPALYGGGGKVIYGDVLTLKVIPKNQELFEKVFETEFTSGGTSPIPFEVYEVPIDGETYLFGSTGVRFCRVPPEVGYSISFVQEEQPREYIMTVDFDDPTLDPLIFSWRKYNLISASRETVPWLFDKPEEDTPEKGAGGKSAAMETGGVRQSEPLGQGTRPADGREPPSAPAWWPWIGAAAVFFVTALWAIRRRVA